MWWVWYRIRKRTGFLGVGVALFVPILLQLIAEVCFVLQIVLGVITFGGFLIILWVIFSPLGDEIPPLLNSLVKSKVAWGLWYTGDRISEGNYLEKSHSLKRILLLDPQGKHYAKHFQQTIDTPERAMQQIKNLTKQAKSKGIKVKWYHQEQYQSYILYDIREQEEPSSDKSWCVIESLQPHVLREGRPRSIIKMASNPTQYGILLNRYKKLWDNSREPTQEEYGEFNSG